MLSDDEILARAKVIQDLRQQEIDSVAAAARHKRYQEESARITAKLKAAIENTLSRGVSDQQLDDIQDAVATYREDSEYL